jgi:hypothetical protein
MPRHTALVVLLLVACGGPADPPADGSELDGGSVLDGGPRPDGGFPDGSRDDGGGLDGTTPLGDAGAACGACAIETPTCGHYIDSCGAIVDCGLCTFSTTASTTERVLSSPAPSAARTASGEVQVAVASSSDIVIAHWDGTAFTTREVAAPGEGSSATGIGLAIAPDGTRWLTYYDAPELRVRRALAGGAWEDAGTLGGGGPAISTALGSDGVPFVSFEDGGDLVVAHWNGAGWDRETATTEAAINQPALAVAGTTPMLALSTFDGVLIAERVGGVWATTTVDPDGAGRPIAMVVDPSGEPAIASLDDDDAFIVYRRSGAMWTSTRSADFGGVFTQSLAMAFDGAGSLWIATGGSEPYLANAAAGVVPVQRVHRRCNSRVSLVAGADGALLVVDACDGTLEAHARTGNVEAAYDADCAAIAEGMCAQACDVCGAGRCCWNWSTGSSCNGPLDCELRFLVNACGDVADGPTSLDACLAAVPTTTCNIDGALLPADCDALY